MDYIRVAGSGLSIGMASLLLAGATFAYFNDQGNSTGNIFSAGTVVMKLSDTDEIDQDNITGSLGFINAPPGETFDDTFQVRNTGTARARSIKFDFQNTITEGAPPGNVSTIPITSVIRILTLTFDNLNLLVIGTIEDRNLNGIIDLDDIDKTDIPFISYNDPQANNHTFHIQGLLHPDYTVNQHQGDSVKVDLTVTVSQQNPD